MSIKIKILLFTWLFLPLFVFGIGVMILDSGGVVYSPSPYLDPDGDDGVNNWIPSAGSDHYAMIDDGTRQPTAPSTGTYLVTAGAATEEFTMSDAPAGVSTSSIKIWIYGYGGVAVTVTGDLHIGGAWQGAQDFNIDINNSWKSITFAGGPWNQAALNAVKVRLICDSALYYCYEMYVHSTY